MIDRKFDVADGSEPDEERERNEHGRLWEWNPDPDDETVAWEYTFKPVFEENAIGYFVRRLVAVFPVALVGCEKFENIETLTFEDSYEKIRFSVAWRYLDDGFVEITHTPIPLGAHTVFEFVARFVGGDRTWYEAPVTQMYYPLVKD